jgi:thymidine kinase
MSRLRVFYGPMCSGKTHELIKAALLLTPRFRAREVLKPSADTRTGLALSSRTGLALPGARQLPDFDATTVSSGTLYVVDEAQFFPAASLLRFAAAVLARPGAALLAAGLDLDFAAQPFGGTLALGARARALPAGEGAALRLAARCCAPGCGAPAPLTQRLASAGSAGTVLVGGAEFYRPACALHHSPAPVDGAGWAAGA